jgi:hypothetical protein
LDHVALRADACRGVGNRVLRAGAEVVLHTGSAVLTVEALDFEGPSSVYSDAPGAGGPDAPGAVRPLPGASG